jgi:hypothetical protein
VEFQHKSAVYRQHGTRLVKRSFEAARTTRRVSKLDDDNEGDKRKRKISFPAISEKMFLGGYEENAKSAVINILGTKFFCMDRKNIFWGYEHFAKCADINY